jgi:hypothetical protein
MRGILLLGIAFTLAACGTDRAAGPPPAPTPSQVAGRYELATVDGAALPLTTFESGAYRVLLVDGALTLSPDGTYSLAVGYRIDDSGNIRTGTAGDTGRWTLTGAAIDLASTTDGTPRTATVSGAMITLQSGGRVLVLRR